MTAAVPPARRAAPLVLVLLVAAALLLVYRVAEYLLLAFIATLIAVYLGAATDWMCRRVRVPRGPGLVLALILSLLVVFGIGALLAPAVIQQTQELIAAIPRYLTQLDGRLREWVVRYPVLAQSGLVSDQGGVISTGIADMMAFIRHGIAPVASATGRVLIEGVAVLVMSLYLARSPDVYSDGVVSLVPPVHRDAARAILTDLGATLRAWVGAQILAMVVLALLTALGLLVLGVPYWLAFGVFAGFVAIVPFFGTLVSTLLPAVLVLGDRGPLVALAVASVGVVVHVIEANVVSPVIMQHRVSLPPVLTILSVMIMGQLAGLLGLVVAVPTLATVIVLVRHILLYRVYSARGETAGAPPPAVLRRSREVVAPVISGT